MLDIIFHSFGDPVPVWPDLKDPIITQEPIGVAILELGMASGRPSVAFRITTKDSVVIAETSALQIVTLARMIVARYPDIFD